MSRPMRRLVIDGIDLDPTSILADDFLVDYEAGKVMLTIRFDNLHVSYADEAPEEPANEFQVGDVVLAKPYGHKVRIVELAFDLNAPIARIQYLDSVGPEFPRVLPLRELAQL